MPLLKNNAFVEDDWIHLADNQPVGSLTKVTVTAERLVRDWDELVRLPGLLGIRLSNTTREFDLNPYLPQLALVVLPFPAFNDGRSYSIARQLRLDGYQSELRAAGNILPDQLQFMLQVGFDTFDVSDRFPLDVWQKASRQMSLAYQRGLFRKTGEREVWSERHQGFAPWEEQPHAG
ncbi:DUF934 domain-containing protein [Aestuariivirga sp.]|uniref:DUF934 domain-containing protein n=1 Tax=Aestuariivirga sp. TaxID=2650926 RepID=UPI0039E53A21